MYSAANRSRIGGICFFPFPSPADFLAAFFLAGLAFAVFAIAPVYGLVVIADVEMAACAAVGLQMLAFDLERAALGAESLDLGLRLVVSEEAGFAGTAAAF